MALTRLGKVETLVSSLNGLCDAQPFFSAWHLKVLRSGETAHRNGNVVTPSASTRKVAIMMAALKAVREGKLALAQPVTIQAKYQGFETGCFEHFQPGFTIQFRDALVMMIIASDNVCTGTIADMVGLDQVNALCRAIGMKGTTHRHGIPPNGLPRNHPVEATNATTAADMGLLLDLVLQGSRDAKVAAKLGCTPELCRLALDIMSWQMLKVRLPYMLPEGTKVAHKTGTYGRNYNDAGIIYQGQEPLFILAAFTECLPTELPDGTAARHATSRLIASLARACYDALKQ